MYLDKRYSFRKELFLGVPARFLPSGTASISRVTALRSAIASLVMRLVYPIFRSGLNNQLIVSCEVTHPELHCPALIRGEQRRGVVPDASIPRFLCTCSTPGPQGLYTGCSAHNPSARGFSQVPRRIFTVFWSVLKIGTNTFKHRASGPRTGAVVVVLSGAVPPRHLASLERPRSLLQ